MLEALGASVLGGAERLQYPEEVGTNSRQLYY